MNKQILSEEFKRMHKLAGIIKEEFFKTQTKNSLEENQKSIDDIGFKMYQDSIYQDWVDNIWDYLEKHKPGFTEQDVIKLTKYAQSSLAEVVDDNIQTYFRPETL